MNFASDNTGPAHPKVMEALLAANEGYTPSYGADAAMTELRDQIRAIFEAPEAVVYLVATGSAANALILATLSQPWQVIYCADVAHIEEDECGAPEFFTGGAKLGLIDTTDGRMNPDALRDRIEATAHGDVHGVQRGPVSLTSVTELGTIYGLDHLRALSDVAHHHNLPVHLDGARFANAVSALGCSAADMSWRAGVDAVSFGGTKNGLLGVEAVIFFDPAHAWEFELRRKRAGHLSSKHRYLSAQMAAYLSDDLWLHMARDANAAGAYLRAGLAGSNAVEILHEPGANMTFARWPRALHQRLKAAGAQYKMHGALEGDPAEPISARLVCDWSAQARDTDRFLDLLRGHSVAAQI